MFKGEKLNLWKPWNSLFYDDAADEKRLISEPLKSFCLCPKKGWLSKLLHYENWTKS